MKKFFLFSMVGCLILFSLTACSDSDASKPNSSETDLQSQTEAVQENPVNTDELETVPETYAFEVDNTVIRMHEKAKPVLEALGEEETYFEADSCAFQGKDRMYGYGSFEVVTYELEGEEHILSVILYNDNVKTKEGLRLFEGKEKVLELYGAPHGGNDKLLVYEDAVTSISFILDDLDLVVGIEYNAVIE